MTPSQSKAKARPKAKTKPRQKTKTKKESKTRPKLKSKSKVLASKTSSRSRPPIPTKLRDFQSLAKIVKALRDPVSGCPWDLEQTHRSLVRHMIEEAFELVEAIENEDIPNMVEELGDVLLQVVLHSEIARQAGLFDILDVIEKLNRKMISRHSHVFGDATAANATEALENWEKQKKIEKQGRKVKPSFDVPLGLPALQRSSKIGAKTRRHNFDWPSVDGVFLKLDEELSELKQALQSGQKAAIEEELGDLLFTCSQIARHLEVDPETALRAANRKFETRFFKMKEMVESSGQKLEDLSPEKIEAAHRAAKLELKSEK